MKKIFILLNFVLLGIFGLSYAQPAASYNFSSKIGSYTEITGGTTVTNLLGDDIRDEVWNNNLIGQKKGDKPYVKGVGFPLGFNFTFNSIIMNRFAFDAHGALYLGKDTVESEGSRGRLAFSEETRGNFNFIGCVFFNWQDAFGLPSTQISYQISGTAPNQILTLQYKNIGLKLDSWGNKFDSLNFQIKLYENESKIEMVFGKCQFLEKQNMTFLAGIGLKGYAKDMHIRDAQENWNTSTYSDYFKPSSTDGKCCKLSDDVFPAQGLTYTFTRPSACTTPSIQPTNLVFDINSTKLNGSFTKTINPNYRYLVVMSPNASLSTLPLDKTLYSIGDKIGEGEVLYFGKDSIFEATVIPASTQYIYVFTTDYLCSEGLKYNTTNPLTASIKALPEGPTSLTFTKASFESIGFSVVANAAKDEVLVAITDVPGSDEFNPITEGGTFGNPNGTIYQVGDTIKGGGIVIYRGESTNGVVIDDLMQNSIYHLQAWSIDSRENLYSSLYATADTITLASVPYLQAFGKEPSGVPMGWSSDSTVKFVIGQDLIAGEYIPRVSTGYLKATAQTNIHTSPWIKMSSEKENRLLFRYNMNYYGKSKLPWNTWDEKDSIILQYTLDGNNYINFAVIDHTNRDEFATATSIAMRRFPIIGVKGQFAKIRIVWHNEKLTPSLSIYAIEIDEIGECDYPLEISVNQASIQGSNATVSWKAVDGVQLYNLRYSVAGSNQWSLIENIDKTTHTITTLPGNSKVNVQVQSKCSQESLSRFYATVSFNSGYTVPFMETFNFVNYATNVRVLPFWEARRGEEIDMTDIITFRTGTSWAKGKWNGISSDFDCMTVSPSGNSNWLMVPKVNLGNGKYNYKLVFDFSIFNASDKLAPTTMDKRSNFNVVISTDSGKTWLKKNTLFRLDSVNNSLLTAAGGKTFEVDLTGYKGEIQIGLMYATHVSENISAYLDNIGILPTCAPITNLKASKVVSDSIYFEWKSTSTNFLTQFNNGVVSTTTQKTMKFGDLTPQTEYTFAVATVCKEGDTSWMETVKITTASVKNCEIPTDVSVSDIKKTSAKLSWTGDAQTYKIRFKNETATTWVTQIADKTSADLIALSLNTTYQYSIQSICSNADGDTSAWTEIATFKTADLSCFAPTELKTIEVKHTSATLTWRSTAINFEFVYRLGTSGDWVISKNSAPNAINLSGLTANTIYNARVRGICAADDTSAWSEIYAFQTALTPICVTPANLRSQNATINSADILWDKDESHLTWLVRYRISTASKWDSIKDLTVNQYALKNLVPASAYTWTVQASCDEGRISPWGNQANFTTIDVNNDKIAAAMLEVFASNGQIHLLNKGGMNIQKIEIMNTLGQIIESHSIGSSDHIIITTQIKNKNVIVRVSSNHFIKSYKLMIP